MNGLSQRLDDGSAKFSAFETKFAAIEERHREHGERLVKVETLLGAMDHKLDSILNEVREK